MIYHQKSKFFVCGVHDSKRNKE